MNFSAFQTSRERLLQADPGLLDCAETNLYRSLSAIQPKPAGLNAGQRIHRCDLARLWLGHYGFSQKEPGRALVCRGVRHALSLIFAEAARTNARVWLPNDVYPTYAELARKAGVEFKEYRSMPKPELPQPSDGENPEYLLIANPWKPLGRFLLDEECVAIINWLEGSRNRRVIIDCVYDLGTPFQQTTRRLWQSERAILLHSVTKGWLWPKTFGVAMVSGGPEGLEAAFRDDPPSQEQLYLAEQLFSEYSDLPERIARALEIRKQRFLATLPQALVEAMVTDVATQNKGNYLFSVRIGAEQLLKQHKIVSVPATAFGSDWGGSVLTSLAAAFGNEAEAQRL